MKKLILLLLLTATAAFGIDKKISAPSGNLILDAKSGNYVKSNKTLQTSTIGTASGDLTLSPATGSGVNIKGRGNGAVPSGYIGEYKSTSSNTGFGGAGAVVMSLSAEKGIWLVVGVVSSKQDGSYPDTEATCYGRQDGSNITVPVKRSTSDPGMFQITPILFVANVTGTSSTIDVWCVDNYSQSSANNQMYIVRIG